MSSELKSMHMGQVTSFFIPNVTLVGQHCSKEIPNRLKALGGKHPLVVTDKGIVACGILKQITDILDNAKVEYTVFDGAVPNPTDKNVEDATKVYLDNKCDSLISIGGGSSHDCAKGVGFVAGNGGRIQDYEGVDKSSKPFPPYVAVNTTAGTGSEMTRFCIITDTARKVKMAIIDWRCTPSVAIDDPVLMMGMPPSLTAATGMDALTHAVEAYVSTAATPMTDACAEKAMEYINRYLRRAVADGSDKEAREGMCYAEYLAGMAFNNASLGTCMPWPTSSAASTTCPTANATPSFSPTSRNTTASLPAAASAKSPRSSVRILPARPLTKLPSSPSRLSASSPRMWASRPASRPAASSMAWK